MNNEKKVIRVAMIMGKMIGGGIEAVVMNYYRHLDHSKIQFDFIIDNDSTIVPRKEIQQFGGRIIEISPYQSILNYSKDLEKLFRKEKYTIVHSHINSLSVFPLRIAKKCGIPIRIAHNHSTAAPGEIKKNILKYTLRLFSTVYPTHYAAPTLYAGQWLFGKKIANNQLEIINNAIDLQHFAYDVETRNKFREQFGYSENEFVVGNIGRFVWQKNQLFIIELFNELLKQRKEARLLLVGEGPLKEVLEKKISELGIADEVTFVSNTKNVNVYYQIMDIFLFPSNYEGLGMVAVEAQVAGLPVIASEKVPVDAKISNNYWQINLSAGKKAWLECLKLVKVDNRESYINDAEKKGYNINNATPKLMNYYRHLFEENDR
ncbi:glycosyltransferase [Enterococcus ureilyticus]|nr:glycosyltransferase [Enterococcus ureilyticus]MBM7689341.1 glycosyltransferase involved in cell wall biosynthesis [Enterococcus ureilyticus]